MTSSNYFFDAEYFLELTCLRNPPQQNPLSIPGYITNIILLKTTGHVTDQQACETSGHLSLNQEKAIEDEVPIRDAIVTSLMIFGHHQVMGHDAISTDPRLRVETIIYRHLVVTEELLDIILLLEDITPDQLIILITLVTNEDGVFRPNLTPHRVISTLNLIMNLREQITR